MSLSALNLGVIISRHQEAVIVIYISHIAASLLHPELPPTVIKHPEDPRRAARELPVVIRVTPVQQVLHTVIAVQRRAQQKRNHMSLMMMDMMISIWMGIMIMTDIVRTVIMRMVWMMQLMSLERIGRESCLGV